MIDSMERFCAILSETSPLQSWSPTGIEQLISAVAIFPRLGTRMRTIFFDHSAICAEGLHFSAFIIAMYLSSNLRS